MPQTPSAHWADINTQRSFMHDMAKRLGLTDQDWHKVTVKSVVQCGGAGLLERYNSLSQLLTTVLPQYKQVCTEMILYNMQELQLSKVEDLLNVPRAYLHDPKLVLRQHDGSIAKCTQYYPRK